MRKDIPLDVLRVYDASRGEVIDFFNGEVEEDRYIVSKPTIRASDYAEWESKRYHEVLISEKDRKLYYIVWNVGEKIDAPKWLRREAVDFYKKLGRIKIEKRIYRKDLPKNFKAVLAIYYVLSHIFKLYDILDNIKSMDCGDGVPCWLNKKKFDRKFRKYVNTVKLYAIYIYENRQSRTPEDIIKHYANKLIFIPQIIIEKALEIAWKKWDKLHTRKDEVIFLVSIILACKKEIRNRAFCNTLRNEICKKLKINPYNINKVLKELEELD